MSTRHDDVHDNARTALKADAPSSGSSNLKPHEIHNLLGNERRYQVIKELALEGSMHWHDLRDKLAALEEDCSVDEVQAAARNRVRASLKQTHFDKLEDANIIEFQGDRVMLGDAATEVTPYIPEVGEPETTSSFTDQLAALF